MNFNAAFLSLLLTMGCASSPSQAVNRARGPQRAAAALPYPMMITDEAMRQGRYLDALVALEGRETDYHGTPLEGSYHEAIGTVLSFVGDDAGALAAFDQRATPAVGQPDAMTGYTARDAVATVLAAADGHRVVMVNEAHHVPKHRSFSQSLLRGLYARGFRYFAAETFAPGVAALKAPTLTMGFYTAEPEFANMVREALALGFRLVPYETDGVGEDAPWPVGQNVRERGEAANLKARIFDRDPAAKVFVHAGYGHIQKDGSGGDWQPMAVAFREMTGLDPLTVDQTGLDEGGPRSERRNYAPMLAALRPTGPVIPYDETGIPFSTAPGYDLAVLHPRATSRSGRPAWRLRGGARKLVRMPAAWREALAAAQGPLLAQAFVPGEPEPRVPVDQFLIRRGREVPAFVLGAGRHEVRLVALEGRVVGSAEVSP